MHQSPLALGFEDWSQRRHSLAPRGATLLSAHRSHCVARAALIWPVGHSRGSLPAPMLLCPWPSARGRPDPPALSRPPSRTPSQGRPILGVHFLAKAQPVSHDVAVEEAITKLQALVTKSAEEFEAAIDAAEKQTPGWSKAIKAMQNNTPSSAQTLFEKSLKSMSRAQDAPPRPKRGAQLQPFDGDPPPPVQDGQRV